MPSLRARKKMAGRAVEPTFRSASLGNRFAEPNRSHDRCAMCDWVEVTEMPPPYPNLIASSSGPPSELHAGAQSTRLRIHNSSRGVNWFRDSHRSDSRHRALEPGRSPRHSERTFWRRGRQAQGHLTRTMSTASRPARQFPATRSSPLFSCTRVPAEIGWL